MVIVGLAAFALNLQDVQVRDAAEFRQAVSSAKAGQRILLAPGEYRGGFSFSGLSGTPEQQIVIGALNPADRPRLSGLHFSRLAYVTIRDLVIDATTGNGINIDDGGSITSPSHHVTLENIHVTQTPRGNIDGLKLSGIDDFIVRRCTIEKWGGSGIDMVGCHRGVIEECTFRSGGDSGVQGKGGTSEITVRRCRFENAGQRALNLGGSTGFQFFRPALDTMPRGGRYEARGLTVEQCVILGSMASVAFVGVDGATVRFNTIYVPDRWAIRILQETASEGFLACQNGSFTDNIVAYRSDKWSAGGVNIGPNTSPQTFRFERNFWYCIDRPSASPPALPVREIGGTYGTDPQFVDESTLDLRVRDGSPASGVGAHARR
jgi:hypothetical protein